jgi:hypothetical protein
MTTIRRRRALGRLLAVADGTFRQVVLSGPMLGVAGGTTVFRATFDLR